MPMFRTAKCATCRDQVDHIKVFFDKLEKLKLFINLFLLFLGLHNKKICDSIKTKNFFKTVVNVERFIIYPKAMKFSEKYFSKLNIGIFVFFGFFYNIVLYIFSFKFCRYRLCFKLYAVKWIKFFKNLWIFSYPKNEIVSNLVSQKHVITQSMKTNMISRRSNFDLAIY